MNFYILYDSINYRKNSKNIKIKFDQTIFDFNNLLWNHNFKLY